jgi:hypothetical protein
MLPQIIESSENDRLIQVGKLNLSLKEGGGIDVSLNIKLGKKTNLRLYHQDYTTPLGNNIKATGVKGSYQIYKNEYNNIFTSGIPDFKYVDAKDNASAVSLSYNLGNLQGITFSEEEETQGLDIGEFAKAREDPFQSLGGIPLPQAEGDTVPLYGFIGFNDASLTFGYEDSKYNDNTFTGFTLGGVTNIITINGMFTIAAEKGEVDLADGTKEDQYGVGLSYTGFNGLSIRASNTSRENSNYEAGVTTLQGSFLGSAAEFKSAGEKSSSNEANVTTYGFNYAPSNNLSIGYSYNSTKDENDVETDSNNSIGLKYAIANDFYAPSFMVGGYFPAVGASGFVDFAGAVSVGFADIADASFGTVFFDPNSSTEPIIVDYDYTTILGFKFAF